MLILSYTREPLEDAVYANRLAYSMHIALQEKDGSFTALNHNSGVLFVKATENEDGSLNPKSLKSPWIFARQEGGYGVVAVRTLAEGEPDTEDVGGVILWRTENFLTYQEEGVLYLEENSRVLEVCCCFDEETGAYRMQWLSGDGSWKERSFQELYGAVGQKPMGEPVVLTREQVLPGAGELSDRSGIQGAVAQNTVEIPGELGEYLRKKLMPAVNNGMEFPVEIRVKGMEELEKLRAMACYSDGTKVPKKVCWDEESLKAADFTCPGRYPLKGRVYQPHFAFPLAINRADPCVCRWEGKYYFIATNDADNNHTLYIRQADDLEGLATAQEHLILDSSTYEDIGGLLWAPEFHVIDGRMYLFHAATPEPFFCEESHLMALREGGDPLKKEDWSRPRRIVRRDGSELCEAGKEITLDMTEFEWEGSLYVIWSQRQFLPKDLGAWLYIAKLNPEKPWMLDSDPVILSKPEYGWANNHTFVDEGPFALIRGDKLYVTFSSAAVDSTYVVGLLSIDAGKDLLDRAAWTKTGYPIFTSRSMEGEYGTGHNAYVIDEDGIVWNTYHARPGVDGPRSSGIRRVHFDVDGAPMLDVTEDLDLKPEFALVETVLVVE